MNEIEHRPWGKYEVLLDDPTTKVKNYSKSKSKIVLPISPQTTRMLDRHKR